MVSGRKHKAGSIKKKHTRAQARKQSAPAKVYKKPSHRAPQTPKQHTIGGFTDGVAHGIMPPAYGDSPPGTLAATPQIIGYAASGIKGLAKGADEIFSMFRKNELQKLFNQDKITPKQLDAIKASPNPDAAADALIKSKFVKGYTGAFGDKRYMQSNKAAPEQRFDSRNAPSAPWERQPATQAQMTTIREQEGTLLRQGLKQGDLATLDATLPFLNKAEASNIIKNQKNLLSGGLNLDPQGIGKSLPSKQIKAGEASPAQYKALFNLGKLSGESGKGIPETMLPISKREASYIMSGGTWDAVMKARAIGLKPPTPRQSRQLRNDANQDKPFWHFPKTGSQHDN